MRMKSFTEKTLYLIDDVVAVAHEQGTRFFVAWVGGALALFLFLAAVGWLPPVFTDSAEEAFADGERVVDASAIFAGPERPDAAVAGAGALPARVVIDKIGVDTAVSNPSSQAIEVLDQALVDGAVRYPGSATLEESGNLFLFAHSSYLPRVINPAYKAFNGLKDLEQGDIIRVQSGEKEYIYKVATVSLVDANEAWVDLSGSERKLTLSTCNTFGQKEDRFVVEADFIGSYEL